MAAAIRQRIVGFHAEEKRFDEARGEARGAIAETQPGGGERQHFAQHHPDDARPLRAKRHADADLARAPRHRVCHGAIQPHAGDQQRQRREAAAEIGEGAFLRNGLFDALRLGGDRR